MRTAQFDVVSILLLSISSLLCPRCALGCLSTPLHYYLVVSLSIVFSRPTHFFSARLVELGGWLYIVSACLMPCWRSQDGQCAAWRVAGGLAAGPRGVCMVKLWVGLGLGLGLWLWRGLSLCLGYGLGYSLG